MIVKNISGGFLSFFDLSMPDEEVIGDLGGTDLKIKGLANGNVYNLGEGNTLDAINNSIELRDYINADSLIMVDGVFEFSKAETLRALPSVSVIHPPFFHNINPPLLNPNTTGTTMVISGEAFSNDTIVKFDTDRIEVTETRVFSPKLLEVDVDVSGVTDIGDVHIALFNGCKSSEIYSINLGISALQVRTLPNGDEKYLAISEASGDNYIGTSFASTEYSNTYDSSKAFDNNNGSRHYCEYGQQQDHFCGIILTEPTLLTKAAYSGSNGSDPFLIEGSNNTTNGNDGTWDSILSVSLDNNLLDITGQYVYTAFRLKWTNPLNGAYASAREIKLMGRQ